jgi:hypothetical protein
MGVSLCSNAATGESNKTIANATRIHIASASPFGGAEAGSYS